MTQTQGDAAVAELADGLWKDILGRSPLRGTFLGIEVDDGALDDTSEDARLDERAMWERAAAAAAAIGDGGLSVESRITRDVIRLGAASAILQDDVRMDLLRAVDHMEGVQALMPQIAVFQDASTRERLETFLRRLAAFPAFMDGYVERLHEAERRGLTASRISVERLIEQMDAMLAIPLERSPIVVAVNVSGDAERARVAAAVREHVDPQLRRYLDPRELHDIGLAEWESIRAEMQEIARDLGFGGDVEAMRDAIEADPSNVVATPDAMVDRIREDIDRAYAAARGVFGAFPEAPCDVRPVEPFKEKDAPMAYYFSPAADGSRPGVYYVNTYELPSRFLHALAAVTYHEAIPGHHMQIALEQELTALPDLRRFGSEIAGNAYVEGWGLYSERLADELGLYRSQQERFGMLQGQAHRAARLVVDTGLHAFGWERDRGVAFLEEIGLPRVDAEIETDRYIAWPGQALCYKVGQRVIERTRRAIEARDGDRFDIKSFHDQAIGHGQIPLPVFEAEMPTWVRPRA